MLLEDLLEEFRFHCECRRLSEKTIGNYLKQIRYLLSDLRAQYDVTELEKVKPQYIKAFLVAKQREGRKTAYVNDLLKAFRVFFKYAYEEEYTDKLLTAKIPNLKQSKVIIRTFSKKEIRKMLDCFCENNFQSVRNRAILVMFFDTGIRLSELIELTDEQLHDDFIMIHGKGEKERVVPKSPVLSKCLLRYIRTRNSYFNDGRGFEGLFVSKYGKKLSKSMVAKIIKEAGDYAGVSEDIRVSPHTLRHTFAQQQLKNGLDIYSLSRLMGHESISITQRYLEGMRDTEVLKSAKATSTVMNL